MDIPPDQLDVKLLAELLDPYKTLTDQVPEFWRSTDSVTPEMVAQCLENGTLKSEYYLNLVEDDEEGSEWTTTDHAARIAWLVVNVCSDPIELDFGIPSLGHSWYPLLDGHHRLAAAIYREDPWILANCSGDVEEIARFRWKQT